MFQFTDEEVKKFRERSEKNKIISLLSVRIKDFLAHEISVPKEGIANWSHYYYCPECSVQLIFDVESPYDHVCPSCLKHFSDPNMDGAWWRLMNSFNEKALYDLGLLYMLTEDIEYAKSAKKILIEYASYYPGYKEHGDIPYNGPGKLNAQTLDEANFLRNMAYGYDLIETALSNDERAFIKRNLFEEGISFLKEHRHNQIHNHEVICNGAIGVLALILSDYDSLSFSIDGKYGLLYQLEHGTFEDGFWFECSTAYHLYALQNFLLYERFARHTTHSNLSHPFYRKMIESILRLSKSDYSLPLLNDSHINQGDPDSYNLFEFAYSTWKIPSLLNILETIYSKKERLSIESFLYGVDILPKPEKKLKLLNLKGTEGLGSSIIRKGPIYLLLRHGPYGGEHDHYDRLGFSYYYENIPISIDMGTTGYGAKLHYAYYKRTGTHNTVSINEGNQSPSKGELISFAEDDESAEVSARVIWKDNYTMPDSFTIHQWDDEAYRSAVFTRSMKVSAYGILDIFRVSVPDERTIDYSIHFHGERMTAFSGNQCTISNKEPFCYLRNIVKIDGNKLFSAYRNSGVNTDVYTFAPDSMIYVATGFDNPSNKDMSFVIARHKGKAAFFVTLISSYRDEKIIKDVSINNDEKDILSITFCDGKIVDEYIGG